MSRRCPLTPCLTVADLQVTSAKTASVQGRLFLVPPPALTFLRRSHRFGSQTRRRLLPRREPREHWRSLTPRDANEPASGPPADDAAFRARTRLHLRESRNA